MGMGSALADLTAKPRPSTPSLILPVSQDWAVKTFLEHAIALAQQQPALKAWLCLLDTLKTLSRGSQHPPAFDRAHKSPKGPPPCRGLCGSEFEEECFCSSSGPIAHLPPGRLIGDILPPPELLSLPIPTSCPLGIASSSRISCASSASPGLVANGPVPRVVTGQHVSLSRTLSPPKDIWSG